MRLLVLLVVATLIVGCGTSEGEDTPDSGAVVTERIDLPPPDTSGGGTLTDALARRRSTRDFQPVPLVLEQTSQLMWAAQGVTSSTGQRTAPSAGALYPLELYLATADGTYHYDPDNHRLEVLGDDDVRRDLHRAAFDQDAVRNAPAVFIVTAVYSRTEQKYGDRAERYVKLEAGHAAQNLLLQAASLDLGAVPMGAFRDDDVQDVLALPDDHEPLYLIPVGAPVG